MVLRSVRVDCLRSVKRLFTEIYLDCAESQHQAFLDRAYTPEKTARSMFQLANLIGDILVGKIEGQIPTEGKGAATRHEKLGGLKVCALYHNLLFNGPPSFA
jgi:hypothetical protein